MPVAVAVLLLSGCSGQAPVQKTPLQGYAGEPTGIAVPSTAAGGAPWASWLDGGKEFSVTLYGTSACPAATTGYSVQAPDEVALHVAGNCPLEYQPYTSIYQTPPTIDQAVTIRFSAQGMYFYLAPLPKG